MKKIFSILCTFVISSIAISQSQINTVTINVTGNRTKQIGVDSKYYTIDNNSITDEQVIVINNMENGQHILDIVRSNQFNKTSSYPNLLPLRHSARLRERPRLRNKCRAERRHHHAFPVLAGKHEGVGSPAFDGVDQLPFAPLCQGEPRLRHRS